MIDSEIFRSYKDHVSSFTSCSADAWRIIEGVASIGFLKKGELLLHEGKVCNYIDYIYSGSVRAFSNKDGNEITTGIYLNNRCITNMKSLSTQTPSALSLQALEDVVYVRIYKESLERSYSLSSELQSIGRALLEAMIVEENDWKEMYTLYDPEERYIFLMKKSPEMFNRVPLQHVASFLGIRRETLSRIRKRTSKTQI